MTGCVGILTISPRMHVGDVVAGKYELTRRLGRGATGLVWAARHRQTGREFAIKFMHSHLMRSRDAKARFEREARAPAQIGHPAIVDVFDVGSLESGEMFLVMELVGGEPLSTALERDPPLGFTEFIAVMRDVSAALAAAHEAGIVHRDLKPDNIFVHADRTTGKVRGKVLDFGLSKLVADEELTRTGALIGTPAFMSPEQALDASVADWRADIWAVGVLLFWGITGQFPHDGDTAVAVLYNLVGQPPRSIDELAPDIDDELRAVIRDCLRPLAERTQTAHDIEARLGRVVKGTMLSPRTSVVASTLPGDPPLEVPIPQEWVEETTRLPSKFPGATPFGHARSTPPTPVLHWKWPALLVAVTCAVAGIALVTFRVADAPVAQLAPALQEIVDRHEIEAHEVAAPPSSASASASVSASAAPPQPAVRTRPAPTPKSRPAPSPSSSATPMEQLENLGSGL